MGFFLFVLKIFNESFIRVFSWGNFYNKERKIVLSFKAAQRDFKFNLEMHVFFWDDEVGDN